MIDPLEKYDNEEIVLEDYVWTYPSVPEIPKELLKSAEWVKNNLKNNYDTEFFRQLKYAGYIVNGTSEQPLVDWLQPYFEYPIYVRYIHQGGDLNVHSDVNTADQFKFAYYIDLGGDEVWTQWFDRESSTANVIAKAKFEKNHWYRFEIHVPHNIKGVEENRIRQSIAVTFMKG